MIFMGFWGSIDLVRGEKSSVWVVVLQRVGNGAGV